MTQTYIQTIRKKCIEANEDITSGYSIIETYGETNRGVKALVKKGRPIRLADVLLAIPSMPNRQENVLETVYIWNLLKDNLDGQSEETLQFISELLA